ncbi:MAG: DegT/DnrJ/EryC1/StrS family aminotransferase, partial [Candidatus Latescibacteria bacterium]|nr:DegT/DnrJ/EryC1/StrS family aminotransferase [Candidatus Latescibacterota bacterium]
MSRLAIEGGDPVRTDPFPPWPYFYEDEKRAVQEVLDSGKVNYWTGSLGMDFQDRFAQYCGAAFGIAVCNGTAALHVALAAANIGPGDEVIVPARTFIASASAVLNQNAIPVFADVDPESHTIDPKSVASLVNDRTRGVIAVHLAGHPAEMDPLMEIADTHGLVVIEDAAQAHGAEYRGRKVGSLGHLAAFSFCQDKIFTTGGEGGMVTTSDEEMARTARTFKDHGCLEEERRSLLEMEQLYTYIHHRMGYNYRMTEMQAAIGLKALDRLDWNVEIRRRNAHHLKKQL